ncbi:unnamed protein product [Moneuplotes crassus]|uniref:Uncharacterized protein n=1 Tax=Euplotes crassus TaxID=5936 RepID=A0AAD1XNJ7_EUPCR|nr:unnamed protein product [Moneuplotes crassus]
MKGKETSCDRSLYVLTEATLIVGAIPSVILFILAISTCLILLIEQDDYDKCIATKKAQKILAGGNSDDISDYLDWNLTGSSIASYVFLIFYGQMLFLIMPFLYKYTGVLIILVMTLMFGFNIAATIWIIDNDCDDTTYYYTAIANNAIQYILSILVLLVSLIVFCCAGSKSSNDSARVANELRKEAKPTELPNSKQEERKDEKWEDNKNEDKKDNNGDQWANNNEDKSNIGNSWDGINDKDEEEEEIY